MENISSSQQESKLIREEKMEKLLNQILLDRVYVMEKELAEKQNLIEQLKGSLQDKDKLMQEQLRQKDKQIDRLRELGRSLDDRQRAVHRVLVQGFTDTLSGCDDFGMKRIGEIDQKAFLRACELKFPADEAKRKAREFHSSWQEKLKNPEWNRFQIIEKGDQKSDSQNILKEDDQSLQDLKNEFGEEIYNMVVTAMKELNEYSLSGHRTTTELWNFKENRKASPEEVISYMFGEMRSLQRKQAQRSNEMSNLSIGRILEKHVLTGPNFLDWIRNLRLVLRQEKVEYVLDTPIPIVPKEAVELATFDVAAHKKHLDDARNVQCVMLAAMSSELQRQHFDMKPYEMLDHLKSLFYSQSKIIQFELFREIIGCRLQEGENVSDHVLKMIGLIEELAAAGIKFENHVRVIFILLSLPDSYSMFIMNYNMNAKEAELHNMLKTYGQTINKGKNVLMVGSSSNTFAGNRLKIRFKQENNASSGQKLHALKPKGGIQKQGKVQNDVCLYCKQKGHWKRDCEKAKAGEVLTLGASGSDKGDS